MSQAMASATSDGRAKRRIGIMPLDDSPTAPAARSASVWRVSVSPGATALTRRPEAAWVAAAERVSPSTPALAAAMASKPGSPTEATAAETSTMEPP